MKTTTKRLCAAMLSAAFVLPALLPLHTAEAGIGGGIGVTFPVSRSAGKADTVSYAAVRVDDVAQELTVEEKGGRLLLRLKVHNAGENVYMVEHPTGQNYDFALVDAKGKELWRWSDAMAFTQAFQTFAIEPGTSQEFTAEIDRKTYRPLRDKAVLAVAGLTDTGVYLSAEVPDTRGSGRRGTSIHGDIVFGNGGWWWPRW